MLDLPADATRFTILDLPADATRYLMGYLTNRELLGLRGSCKKLHTLVQDNALHSMALNTRIANLYQPLVCRPNIQERKYQILNRFDYHSEDSYICIPIENDRFAIRRLLYLHKFGVIRDKLAEIENFHVADVDMSEDLRTYVNSNRTIKTSRGLVEGEAFKSIQVKDRKVTLNKSQSLIWIESNGKQESLSGEGVEDIAVTYHHLLAITKKGLKVYDLKTLKFLYCLHSVKGTGIVALKGGSQFVVKDKKALTLMTWEGKDLKTNIKDNWAVDKFLTLCANIRRLAKKFISKALEFAKVMVLPSALFCGSIITGATIAALMGGGLTLPAFGVIVLVSLIACACLDIPMLIAITTACVVIDEILEV